MTARVLFPVPLAVAIVVSAGVAGLVFVRTVPYLTWAFGDWTAVSAEMRQAVGLAGPWTAVGAAWLSGRFTNANGLLCPPSAVRSGSGLVIRQFSALYACAAVGYLIGLLPVLLTTAVRANVGNLNVLVLLGSLTALLAFASVGYLVGSVFPWTVSMVVALTASYATVLLADTMSPAVAPIWSFDVVVGQVESALVSVFRLGFFLLLGLSSLLSASLWLRNRSSETTMTAMASFSILVLPLALILPAGRAPAPVSPELRPPFVCEDQDGISVCVHAAKEPLLFPLKQAVHDVVKVLGPALRPERVMDAALWPPQDPDTVVVSLQVQQGRRWPDAAVEDMAWQLSGAAACATGVFVNGRTTPEELDAAAVSAAVALWVAREAGVNGPGLSSSPDALLLADRLAATPVEDVQDFLASRREELAACEAASSLLP